MQDDYYHILNRGEMQQVFPEDSDYLFFLSRLREFRKMHRISILCYCLVPNYFHVFVKQLTEKGLVNNFANDLTEAYTSYFNEKYNKIGYLFGGATKIKQIENPDHFLWLNYYIHNIPSKTKLVQKSENWVFSDLKDYIGLRRGTLSDKEEILSRFKSPKDYRDFISKPEMHIKYEKILPPEW
jgi:putative transposase